jgi:hypothetical protein
MAFVAKDSGGGGDFKRVPPGAYIGRCYSLIDLGTQTSNWEGEEKSQHKIKIGWELFGEDEDGNALTMLIDGKDMPMTISKNYTLSLHEKAGLRKDLASWRGKDFSEEEAKAFDVAKLLGAFCMVNVTTSEKAGKTYTNVAGLTPLPGALKNAKPAAVHANVTFDLDAPDMKVFAGFYEKLQEQIKSSPEWSGAHQKPRASQHVGEFDNEEVPF